MTGTSRDALAQLTPHHEGPSAEDTSRRDPPAKRGRPSPVARPAAEDQRLQQQIEELTASLSQLRAAVHRPSEGTLVVWNRSRIAHKVGIDEQRNIPAQWRTLCGRPYGLGVFHRIPAIEGDFTPCKRCFQLPVEQESASEEDSSMDDSSSTDEDTAAASRFPALSRK